MRVPSLPIAFIYYEYLWTLSSCWNRSCNREGRFMSSGSLRTERRFNYAIYSCSRCRYTDGQPAQEIRCWVSHWAR